MYHELLLHASVPSYRHDQVLSILAGVTAQPPTSLQQRQYIFSPKRMPAPKPATKGGSQEIGNKRQVKEVGDVYMLRLVHELDEDAGEDEVEESAQATEDVHIADASDEATANDSNTKEAKESTESPPKKPQRRGKWQLAFYDTPEPGKRSVTSRLAQVTDIVEGDAVAFVEGMGYRCSTQYLTLGHTFVHNNIIIHIYRILPLAASTSADDTSKALAGAKDLKPLDANEGYLLEAKIRLLDGGQPDLVAQGTQELTQFRENMKGALDLRVVDRLSLDTKVTVR